MLCIVNQVREGSTSYVFSTSSQHDTFWVRVSSRCIFWTRIIIILCAIARGPKCQDRLSQVLFKFLKAHSKNLFKTKFIKRTFTWKFNTPSYRPEISYFLGVWFPNPIKAHTFGYIPIQKSTRALVSTPNVLQAHKSYRPLPMVSWCVYDHYVVCICLAMSTMLPWWLRRGMLIWSLWCSRWVQGVYTVCARVCEVCI